MTPLSVYLEGEAHRLLGVYGYQVHTHSEQNPGPTHSRNWAKGRKQLKHLKSLTVYPSEKYFKSRC